MPDLTIEVHFHCDSDREWSAEVKGKSGTYTVTWDRFSHKNRGQVQYDYSCTCQGYKFHKGYCKHIKEVIKKELRCGWNSFHDSDGKEVAKKNGEFVCPKCGESVFPVQYGV